MWNFTTLMINSVSGRLQNAYDQLYSREEPDYANVATWCCRMALEHISQSNALYHDTEHTAVATLIGHDMLRGKHYRQGDVSPRDWAHVIVSLLCHDIGYVRGICREDQDGVYTTGLPGEMVRLAPGATDAALMAYHVDRSKRFVMECFEGHPLLDATQLVANIERTRFPVPDAGGYQNTADDPGLVRAADLIAQLAGSKRPRRYAALFAEFEETGVNATFGYTCPEDIQDGASSFYWNAVHPYIGQGLHYLRVTQDGQQWVTDLQAHVFQADQREIACA